MDADRLAELEQLADGTTADAAVPDTRGSASYLHTLYSISGGRQGEHSDAVVAFEQAKRRLDAALPELVAALPELLAVIRNQDQRIERAQAIHDGERGGICWECSDPEGGMTVPWPCDTFSALDVTDVKEDQQ